MSTLFLLGDSTCAQKSAEVFPETGWGMYFSQYLKEGWKLENRACNGKSTKSFLDEGDFASVEKSLQRDDYCILQFGHNENKEDEGRYTEPWTTYTKNLINMAERIMEMEAHPIFISSISRRNFLDEQFLMHTLGEYPSAMEAAAEQMNIPFVDATTPTRNAIMELGPIDSQNLFMHFAEGIYPNYPQGRSDDTHLRPEGAELVSKIIYDKLKELFPNLPFLS